MPKEDNMKYNFGLIKNKDVEFYLKENDKTYKISGMLLNVNSYSTKFRFIFSDKMLDIKEDVFLHMKVKYENNIVKFYQTNYEKLISGFFGFTMYDTFGFPLEDTIEILSERDFVLDVEGYNYIKQLQKEKSQNTFNK
jgi:alanyl-tRNA synthetase